MIFAEPLFEFLLLLVIEDPVAGQDFPVAVRRTLRAAPACIAVEFIKEGRLFGLSFLVEIDVDQLAIGRHFVTEAVLGGRFGFPPALQGGRPFGFAFDHASIMLVILSTS